ncbi:MAG: ABC transporter permease [Betaproteobacteria bacterium]
MFETMARDVRHAARLIRRSPLFALTAALSLAVGIGATTTIFAIANGLLLRPPAGVVEPRRLVDIGRVDHWQIDNTSYATYLDVRARATSFTDVYAYRFEPQPMSLNADEHAQAGAERVYGGLVSSNYFSVLGVGPQAGRLFADADDRHGPAYLAVLSDRLWRRRFGADPAIVGRAITLNGRPFTVVGVAPAGFQGTSLLAPDLWVPLTTAADAMPHGGTVLLARRAVWLLMGGRLKPGVTAEKATAELHLIAQALEREYPAENRGQDLRAVPLSAFPGRIAPIAAFVGLLMGLVVLVLAIACTNVTGVQLARAAARRREIAVRLAIGAGRSQLIWQLTAETLLVFAAGAVLGLALARIMTALLVSLLPTLPVPLSLGLGLDWRVLAFTAAVTLAAALLSGLAPGLQAARTDVVSGLKADAPGGRLRMGLRHALVIGQVALSLMLVVVAGLFGRALLRAGSIDPGFAPHGIELASLDLSLARYTDATGPVFARQLLERVRALPDVQSATMAAILPLGGDALGMGGLSVPGVAPPAGQRFLDADWNVVEPGFFETMRMPLVSGRDFTAADRAGAPMAVIVNETAAREWWPGRDPLGQRLFQQKDGPDTKDLTPLIVVGVARDAKYRLLSDAPRPFVFVPLAQQYISRVTLVARSRTGGRLAGELRSVVASLNPNLPIVTSQTLDDHTAFGLVPQRVAGSVAGSLGVVGLLLAAFGVYGATAYAVARRTRDIGIRIALGAGRGDVVGLVLRQGMALVAIGAGIGLAIAAAGARLLGSLLFGVPALDPVTFGGAVLLFAAVGLAACYVPTRRAVAIEAMEALRYE